MIIPWRLKEVLRRIKHQPPATIHPILPNPSNLPDPQPIVKASQRGKSRMGKMGISSNTSRKR